MKRTMIKAGQFFGVILLFSGSVACAQAPIIDLGDGRDGRRASGPVPVSAAGADSGAQGAPVGELLNQLQMLQQEVMSLRGEVERQGHELQQLRQQSLDRYLELDRRVGGGSVAEPGAPAAAAVSPAVGATPVKVSQTPASAPRSAAQPGEYEAYKDAYAKVKAQEFNSATRAFRAFLEKYPEGRYAANAHYWLGELYLVLSPPQPDRALAEFSTLLQDYPDNAKVPDAMLKLGRLYYQKDDRERARQILEKVVRDYRQHDSAAASLAQQFLDQNF